MTGRDDAVRQTLDVYEQHAGTWIERRRPSLGTGPTALRGRASAAGASGPLADLGCGPGWFTPLLGPGAVAIDGAVAMLAAVTREDPTALRVRADLRSLPVRSRSLAGAYAGKSWVHLPRGEVPMALREAHRALAVGAPLEALLFEGDLEHGPFPGDDFAGRSFSTWPAELLHDVLVGAGFVDVTIERTQRGRGATLLVTATRARTLADTIGPGMRLLIVGLNPSLHAADAGCGFVTAGNRFWPAALEAGLVERDRDPRHALGAHGIGMTDLVKRATSAADALSTAEHRDGRARLERLVGWLRPRAVCMVGLAGWRAAFDRGAAEGIQMQGLAGRPVYVMGSTSGRNAHLDHRGAVAHLRAAATLADRS